MKLLQIDVLCSEMTVCHLFKCTFRFPLPTENFPDETGMLAFLSTTNSTFLSGLFSFCLV